MDLNESDRAILCKIDGTEDIAPYLKPDDVLALMRVAKKMQRWIAASEQSAKLDGK